MLRFIHIHRLRTHHYPDFNTSHVTVYQFHYNHTDLLFHHFNTSHVTVYPVKLKYKYEEQQYFNTSHVTVYLKPVDVIKEGAYPFQYISCYGLSKRWCINLLIRNISIHLMLRFITSSNAYHIAEKVISIHLMLRFISDKVLFCLFSCQFQYISCYGLSGKDKFTL